MRKFDNEKCAGSGPHDTLESAGCTGYCEAWGPKDETGWPRCAPCFNRVRAANEIIVRNGLLWDNQNNIIPCNRADQIAQANGFHYVEQLIKQYDNQAIKIDEKDKII